jgi:predicted amino acid racemase
MYPRVEIDLNKLKENVQYLTKECAQQGIGVWAVTKCFCSIPELAKAVIEGGASMLADSRIENLKKLEAFDIPKVLLRIPMPSEVKDVIRYADYSLNSELATLKLLGKAALGKGCIHKVVLMIDLGDLREGIWNTDVDKFVQEAVKIKGIEIKGFGVNLTCYGGVIPNQQNLGQLVDISREMENKYDLKLDFISGGNSSSYHLIQKQSMVEGINNLRLGEIMLLGRETAYGEAVSELHEDVFVLKGELVVVKSKPSVPVGEIGMDAFGNTPTYEDRVTIKRGIIAFGRQDISPEGITPIDEKIDVIGGSSDHTILDLSNSDKDYKVGDVVEFLVDYGCLLRAMTSVYINKVII